MADEVRLIDAKKLKRELIEGDGDDEFTEGYNAAIVDIRGYIDNMPTIEAEPVNGWISVDDRPPDDDVDVLLHDKYCGTLIGWYDKKDDVFKTDYIGQLEAVTRWMPLPEGPKEDKDGKDDKR